MAASSSSMPAKRPRIRLSSSSVFARPGNRFPTSRCRPIDGTGLGAGIRNRGYDSVTIRNGAVQEFDYGVRLQSGANNNLVEGLSLQLNQLAGIEVFDSCEGNQIQGNTLSGNRHGIT